MDVTERRARQEIESARRAQREREEDHARELEGLRDNHREQLKNLEDVQDDTIQRLQESADRNLEGSRKNYDEALSNVSDRYERTLANERRENYDKFGRLNHEHAHEKATENELRTRQFKEYVDQTSNLHDKNRRDNDTHADTLRTKFDDDRRELKKYFDTKLGDTGREHREALAKNSLEARAKVDDGIMKNHERLSKEKLGADLKYQKLVDEAQSDRTNLVKSYQQRERQLIDEKTAGESKQGHSTSKAFEDYRQRSADALGKTINDNKFMQAQRDRENADLVAASEQEHQKKSQTMASEFRRAETALKFENEASKERADLKNTIDERRHKQDVFLNTDAVRKNANLSADIMRQEHSEHLQKLEEGSQQRFQGLSREVQKQMAENQMRAQDELAGLKQKRTEETTLEHLKNAQEKSNIIRQYEDRQNSFEELKKRQEVDLKRSLVEENRTLRDTNAKVVAESAHENQSKLYAAEQKLIHTNTEFDTQRRIERLQNEDSERDRAHRLNANYTRSLLSQKDSFDEATESLRHESMRQTIKMRGDAEHEKRMQLLELQAKNRYMMMAFDSQINQIKEDHAADMGRLKSETDKLVRDALKKAKEQVDTDRSLHSKELDSKDLQMKEKLKVQEESFKEQIEKLKRTNELALKKS